MTRSLPAVAAALLVLGACAVPGQGDHSRSARWTADTTGRSGLGGTPASALGFVRHPDAVDWPASSDWIPSGRGIQILLPAQPCAIGIGNYQNGYRQVTANWSGDASCQRLSLDPGPDGSTNQGDGPPEAVNGWRGGGIDGDAAVAEANGSILTASYYGLSRRRADGQIEPLAKLDLPDRGLPGEGGDGGHVAGLVELPSGRILVGAGQTVSNVASPVLGVSDDKGRTLRRIPLPHPPGLDQQTIGALAADGDTVVAVGSSTGETAPQRRIAAWRSADRGRTWSAAVISGLPAHLMITRLLHTRDHWIAIGSADHEDDHDTTHVFTSSDGLSWTEATRDGIGAGRVTGATVGSDGSLVVIGEINDSRKYGPKENPDHCGVVWIGDASGPWQRGELGCGDAPPQAITTLADGRVLIAGNRDLWVRAAGAPRAG